MPAAFNFLSLLKIIVALGPKIPQAIELLRALFDLFAAEIEATVPAGDGLRMVANTTEEEELMGQISEAMSAEGTRAVFDWSRARKLLTYLNETGWASLFFDFLKSAGG